MRAAWWCQKFCASRFPVRGCHARCVLLVHAHHLRSAPACCAHRAACRAAQGRSLARAPCGAMSSHMHEHGTPPPPPRGSADASSRGHDVEAGHHGAHGHEHRDEHGVPVADEHKENGSPGSAHGHGHEEKSGPDWKGEVLQCCGACACGGEAQRAAHSPTRLKAQTAPAARRSVPCARARVHRRGTRWRTRHARLCLQRSAQRTAPRAEARPVASACTDAFAHAGEGVDVKTDFKLCMKAMARLSQAPRCVNGSQLTCCSIFRCARASTMARACVARCCSTGTTTAACL